MAAPTWGAPAAQQGLDMTVKQLAPLATTWTNAGGGATIKQVINQPTSSVPEPSAVAQFFSKIGSIGKESAHIVAGAANWAFKTGSDLVTSPIKLGVSTYDLGKDAYDTFSYSRQEDELTGRLQNINSSYNKGRITTAQYKVELADFNKDSAQLGSENAGLQSHLTYDSGQVVKDTINTAAAVLTVLTAGVGAPEAIALDDATTSAADFLGSDATEAAFTDAEVSIGKVSVDKQAFDDLPDTAKGPIKNAVTQVLYGSAQDVSASQMSRAAATNLLLNYPLTYSMLSGTGQQVYKELQNDKYGSAVKTLAFNATLLLSGGVIGQALKYGGKALGATSDRLFGSTSFMDEFSKLIGDGNPAGIYNELSGYDAESIHNFSALEATNMAASGGDAVQAAYRVADGLSAAGWDLSTMTHSQVLTDANNWASAQRDLTEAALKKGYSEQDAAKFVVGRWTAADNNFVSAQLTSGGELGYNADTTLSTWQKLKEDNPNASWANNANLDKEITSAIKRSTDASGLDKAIRGIDAQMGVRGIPKALGESIAKRGFVAIVPNNLEAPFKEGVGKLSSEFANKSGEEFFIKSVQPLPVLGSIGAFLTTSGLSPNAAPVRVYDLFTQNLSETVEGISGFDNDRADLVLRQIADYAHTNTLKLGKVAEAPVISDYRQFTIKDIVTATGMSDADARQIKIAIQDSMLRVPLAVRGLGDRLMDINYKINPLASPYAKLQNALRFSFNPIFKARLAYKTEFLSQLEAGGKWPSLLGTNKILETIFPEHYNELDSVAAKLEQKGMFGAGFTAEAADENAAGHASFGHPLLNSQKRSIAGLVNTLADRKGLSVEEYTNAFPEETKDLTRMILQYNPKANFLNSPMARTLNVAFFPFRFDLKVASIMTRTLQRQPAVVQFAFIKGIMQAHQYLNSNEGMAWYSQNSDVIGLFNYFSPLATLSQISEALTGDHANLNNYGELGGLPFGWIPQLLNTEGLSSTSTAYVNPKTGVIDQEYVPISSRGKAQSAIEDFLGAIYTYPGATIGLPSKTKVDVKIAQGLVPGGSTKKDFNLVTPTNLTPQQQQFEQVVQGLHGTNTAATANALTPYGSANQTTQQSMTVPAQPTPVTTPVARTVKKSSGAKKKTKAEQTPYLLPGQTSLGQTPP